MYKICYNPENIKAYLKTINTKYTNPWIDENGNELSDEEAVKRHGLCEIISFCVMLSNDLNEEFEKTAAVVFKKTVDKANFIYLSPINLDFNLATIIETIIQEDAEKSCIFSNNDAGCDMLSEKLYEKTKEMLLLQDLFNCMFDRFIDYHTDNEEQWTAYNRCVAALAESLFLYKDNPKEIALFDKMNDFKDFKEKMNETQTKTLYSLFDKWVTENDIKEIKDAERVADKIIFPFLKHRNSIITYRRMHNPF